MIVGGSGQCDDAAENYGQRSGVMCGWAEIGECGGGSQRGDGRSWGTELL